MTRTRYIDRADRSAFTDANEHEQMRFAQFVEIVVFDGDPRTPVPSFDEWRAIGRPYPRQWFSND